MIVTSMQFPYGNILLEFPFFLDWEGSEAKKKSKTKLSYDIENMQNETITLKK